MARSSRGSRPAARAPAQSRSSSTAAAPSAAPRSAATAPTPPAAAAGAQTSQGPGIMGQIAANAASMAIGSTIGHGVSNMLWGGSNTPAAEAPAAQQTQQNASSCELQAKDFSNCLEKADFQSCSYYFDQLKACQSAAAQY